MDFSHLFPDPPPADSLERVVQITSGVAAAFSAVAEADTVPGAEIDYERIGREAWHDLEEARRVLVARQGEAVTGVLLEQVDTLQDAAGRWIDAAAHHQRASGELSHQ